MLLIRLPMTVVFASIFLGQPSPNTARHPEIYHSAAIDADGNLVVVTSSKKAVIVPRIPEQTAFSMPVISPDRTAVGAKALFANCCTSYDIAMQLVVYANGKVHRFTGTGLPISEWRFSDEGTTVAYGQSEVHFNCETHYELRNVHTEKLLDSFDVPVPCAHVPAPPKVNTPEWVDQLRAQRP